MSWDWCVTFCVLLDFMDWEGGGGWKREFWGFIYCLGGSDRVPNFGDGLDSGGFLMGLVIVLELNVTWHKE